MSGVDFTTISPSSTNSSRRTPWVEGCCGPIEIVICVSSGRSTTSNCGGMFTALLISFRFQVSGFKVPHENLRLETSNLKLLQRIRFIATQRKILAQCVTLPVVRQKNPAQVRMFIKNDSKEIKRFALVPVGRAPHAGNGRNVRVVFVQHDLQAQAMMFGC